MAIYGRILRVPHVAVLIASTTLTRIPFAINALAVLLFLREVSGSYATAGLTAGALAVGAGIAAPVASRLIDRGGATMLLPLAVVHGVAIVALLVLGEAGAPGPVLAGAAFVAGAGFPPSGSVLRSRWSELMDHDPVLTRGAYAFDSVMIELSFVTGPLVTAALVALSGPQAALALSPVLVLAGTLVFVWRLPDRHRRAPAHAASRGFGPLRTPGVRLLALTTIPAGFCLGAVEVSLPAFSEQAGDAALAGVLLALWSAASGAGGLFFGARASTRGLLETYLLFAVIFPLACLPLLAASSPLSMALLVLIAGAPIAPMIATRNELVTTVAPRSSMTEAFTWLLSALIAGIALGTAVSGVVIEAAGWPEAVALGIAVAMLGAITAYAYRADLRPEPVTA